MKLHEFIEMVEREREQVRLTNQEKIAKLVNTTNNTKGKN